MQPDFIALAVPALSIIVLLLSVIIHEVMHGLVALHFGDTTAERAGRLTLNPIPHIDPIGTILLPVLFLFLHTGFFIAWAKPVPVNPLNFSNLRKGELFVSLAGVASNLTLALIGAVLYHLTSTYLPGNPLLIPLFHFMVVINLMLGVFNLLPIPPLDGYNALLSRLPYQVARSYQRLYPYGFFIILALMYFNILGLILFSILIPLLNILGVPPL